MASEPYDWEQGVDEFDDDPAPPTAADWVKHGGVQAPLAWLQGDQEYYPVWSTTLYEQDQIWATHFGLRTSEQRIERLAQEASLFKAANDIAHES